MITTIDTELTFNTVAAVRVKTQQLFQKKQSIIIDLSKVNHCDSAGIALLLDWYRTAKKRGLQLKFRQPTAQIQQLIKLCGLSQLPLAQ